MKIHPFSLFSLAFDCNEADICHENAECLFEPVLQRYQCECVEGYSGDGVYCERYHVGKWL